MEAKEQFDRDVLLSDEYYNGIINCRIGSNAIKRIIPKTILNIILRVQLNFINLNRNQHGKSKREAAKHMIL